MFIIRIFIIAFLVGFAIWYISNKVFGKNLGIAKVIAITLVGTSAVYVFLGALSHFVEGA